MDGAAARAEVVAPAGAERGAAGGGGAAGSVQPRSARGRSQQMTAAPDRWAQRIAASSGEKSANG